ncbi:hypothetical protein [Salinimonas lutimaris]|uniref:hypothetical protein n=1 Tax=Salinimonas lutimaris TaxID=914153 RepID=UPI0010C050AE|nr:hypothetical protein [Salinimonas lutimaris]
MSNVIGSADNSAFYSARQGLNRASEDITQASLGINASGIPPSAGPGAQNASLPGASTQFEGPVAGPVTNELVALTQSRINAQASARVLGVATDMVGQLIDTLA